MQSRIGDRELAWLFVNCFPNTLDTTVTLGKNARGRDDTFVITGDIDAMWLRDSAAQVWPYLPLLREDDALRRLVAGVVNRQVACVLLDPYANAFLPNSHPPSKWPTDQTEMRPGVYERKYELDSLCSVLRLSVGYFRACGDPACFDADWQRAVESILRTVRVEQRGSDGAASSPYRFARRALRGTDTQPLADGQCYPYRRCGLSRSPFRPGRKSSAGWHSFKEITRVGGNPYWREKLDIALHYLHDNKRDPNGHYGDVWGNTGIQTGTVLSSWKLIDQAAVAQAYLNTSINPEPSGAILCMLASLLTLKRRR